jgi:hypothetical protein
MRQGVRWKKTRKGSACIQRQLHDAIRRAWPRKQVSREGTYSSPTSTLGEMSGQDVTKQMSRRYPWRAGTTPLIVKRRSSRLCRTNGPSQGILRTPSLNSSRHRRSRDVKAVTTGRKDKFHSAELRAKGTAVILPHLLPLGEWPGDPMVGYEGPPISAWDIRLNHQSLGAP